MEPPAICPEWATKQGRYTKPASGIHCENCGMPVWDHLLILDPATLVQHSCNEFPYINEWIPYAGPSNTDSLLGITATMEDGKSRKAVRVIGGRPGLIMMDYARTP